jgi:hypothetical protein
LKAEQLKLARNGSPARESVEFDFALEHDMRKRAGVLRRGEIHVGSAPANLTGTYARRVNARGIFVSRRDGECQTVIRGSG